VDQLIVSSGCIRMINQDLIDLYQRTPIGAKVVVLPSRWLRKFAGLTFPYDKGKNHQILSSIDKTRLAPVV
jgi:hypothetical protein